MLNFTSAFILLDIYNNVIGKMVVVVYIHQNALLTIDIDIDLSCYTHINPLMQLNVVIHTWMTWGLSLLLDRTAISKG